MAALFPEISPRILEAIRKHDEVVVIGHKNPDGDCIFSSLALGRMLEHIGKKVVLLNQGEFRNNDTRAYEKYFLKSIPEGLVERKPLVAVVDCSTADRPGEIFTSLLPLETVVFDHHSSGEPFAAEGMSYIVPASTSTTLILDKLRRTLDIPLDKELAEYLYKGFATDSGFFHFINEKTGGEVLRIVSDFIDAGVSPYIVYDELHDGKSLDYFSTVGTLLERTKAAFDGQILYTYIEKDRETDGRPGDVIYANLLQVAGVRIVFFFKELDGSVEIGMRSKNLSGIDIGAFAGSLGGGGHKYAAGATVPGTLDEVTASVLSKAGALL